MKSQSTMYIQRGRLTHVYASLKPIIGSDDGLSPIEVMQKLARFKLALS